MGTEKTRETDNAILPQYDLHCSILGLSQQLHSALFVITSSPSRERETVHLRKVLECWEGVAAGGDIVSDDVR